MKYFKRGAWVLLGALLASAVGCYGPKLTAVQLRAEELNAALQTAVDLDGQLPEEDRYLPALAKLPVVAGKSDLGVDLAGLSVEDSVMLMFMLIADDARRDLREMLSEMEKTREKRQALREATAKAREAAEKMRAAALEEYDALHGATGPTGSLEGYQAAQATESWLAVTGTEEQAVDVYSVEPGPVVISMDCGGNAQPGIFVSLVSLRDGATLAQGYTGTAGTALIRANLESRQPAKVIVRGWNPTRCAGSTQYVRVISPMAGGGRSSVAVRNIVSSAAAATSALFEGLDAVDQLPREGTGAVSGEFAEAFRNSLLQAQPRIPADSKELADAVQSAKDKLDSLNEMSELVSIRLQMYAERRTKAQETLSNLIKKISQTQDTLVQNLK